ncbi:MAG: hypothetical protein E7517_00035 [Ruminococcaceae bacterium]|nr:hypothetical protein [Oscillospiraceae bacterium]
MINGFISIIAASGLKEISKDAYITQLVAIIAFGLAGAALVAAIVFFVVFKIPKIINDFTGNTARKSIAKKRKENEKSGKKIFGPTPKAQDRGPLTDKVQPINNVPPSDKVGSEATDVLPGRMGAQPAGEGSEATDVLPNRMCAQPTGEGSEATDVLPNRMGAQPAGEGSEATDVLPNRMGAQPAGDGSEATDVLPNRMGAQPAGEATTVLQSQGTTVLNRNMATATEALPSRLEMIQNIVLIHTDEII